MKKIKNYQAVGKLFVSKILYNFINKDLLKDTKIKPKQFWIGLERSLYDLREKNEKLLEIRKSLQNSIDKWHLKNREKKTGCTVHYVNSKLDSGKIIIQN